MRMFAIIVCVAVFGALAGCQKSVDESTPGVYQGMTDPLLETQKDPEQQERLRVRFSKAATDR